jgi:hypothetical protein
LGKLGALGESFLARLAYIDLRRPSMKQPLGLGFNLPALRHCDGPNLMRRLKARS